jgi:oxygen-independent coproporphyrinogen III oxidase
VAGIYLHIPFCKQACHYCDFHFSTNRSDQKELTNALVEELRLQRTYLVNKKINTIYFGGGTPSLLSEEELNMIFSSIREMFDVDDQSEITVEANPDDLHEEYLFNLKKLGVNRLSIGIQSFNDYVLKFMNRSHHAQHARDSFLRSRSAGFNNISIDLIYAVPGESEEDWRTQVKEGIALRPEHISAYSLTIEEKTVFGKMFSRGKLHPVDDDHAARQFEILVDELAQAGYEQYEVSNFSLPGFQSKHNSNYWKGEHYLGIGPSAHSYNGVSRQFNIKNNSLYVRSLVSGKIPFELENLSNEEQANEYILTTLRTSWGTDLQKLKERFGYDVVEQNNKYLERLFENELARMTGNVLVLTPKGRLLADKIASDLFVD